MKDKYVTAHASYTKTEAVKEKKHSNTLTGVGSSAF